MIDLHSDTVTKPTSEMREAMKNAEVGDDVLEEDPTVKILENRVATMFQKEAALFFPSGTMSNLVAVFVWCNKRGSEIIVGDNSHMFLYEQGGAAQFGGVSMRTVKNQSNGTMNIDEIRAAIREDDIHEPVTKLICIENTHNACGGKVLPISFLEKLNNLTVDHSIPIHMDGARIWNTLIASGREPYEITRYVDSLSVCLSKGLGCPVGSLLIGSNEFIKRARRIRKGLGGGMRQVGVLAAAGLVGLDDFEKGIIREDHRRTKQIVDEIANMPAFHLMSPIVETNILFLELLNGNANDVANLLKETYGIIISVWSPKLIRIVVHRDINDEMIERTIEVLKIVSRVLLIS
jgi:threonine aldolase